MMAIRKLLILLVSLSAIVSETWAEYRYDFGDDPMQNPDLFEGDILGFDPSDRNAIVDKERLWPNGRVPYDIDPKLDGIKPRILKAMQHYAGKTCIKFEAKQDDDEHFIRIFPGKGCNSKVGKSQTGNPVSLGAGCFKFGTIVHELGHAIGFFHEHSRSDRDDHLEIHRDNIKEGYETQFDKLRPDQNQLLTPFDYDSIMLYGETVFSKDKVSKTMTSKDGRKLVAVNDKPGLSDSDVERIGKLYSCEAK